MLDVTRELRQLARTDASILATQLRITGQVARVKRLSAMDAADTRRAEDLLRLLRGTLAVLQGHRRVIAQALEAVAHARTVT